MYLEISDNQLAKQFFFIGTKTNPKLSQDAALLCDKTNLWNPADILYCRVIR